MRFGGSGARLVLCGALWAAGASAQPVIVDPDPDSDADWGLRLETVVSGGLASPSALVQFGPRLEEALLVLEKDTGLVRHFVQGVEQAVALDLAVDNCGERGLVGIALHPDFDPTPTPVTDPPTERPPSQDWVYLSYHTDAGRLSDGCDADALLRVERFMWTGALLVPDPLVAPDPDPEDEFEPFVPFEKVVDSTTAVSGTLATSVELTSEFAFAARLYLAIGSLERNGRLQNNEDATGLDDTSVVLRLDENGEPPGDNPFDDDPEVAEPQDRYFTYGVRDPRGLAVDPFSNPFGVSLYLTERSDSLPTATDKPDEIDLAFAGTNHGYRDFQGPGPADAASIPPDTLVDLDTKADGEDEGTEPDLVSTYLNPRFSFEDKAVEPTGLAFGGREMGALHFGSLFVGAANGRLFRFPLNASRIGFLLAEPLGDTVADPDDELTDILVAEGFGAISDVETGVDGSLYVLDRTSGAIYRVFSDARRDVAISRVKVPKRITLSATKPTVTKRIRLTLENRGEVAERILSRVEMNNLLGLEISGLLPASCPEPTATVVDPWYVRDPYPYQIGIKPKGKLSLSIDVVWACDSPSPKDTFDFETRFDLNGGAIGIDDEDPANDLCPRPPSEGDKGCGSKGGGPLQTDLIQK